MKQEKGIIRMNMDDFQRLPIYKPVKIIPDKMIGWVNLEDEWYIAEINEKLVRIRRIDMWEAVAATIPTTDFINITDTYREGLTQIFITQG